MTDATAPPSAGAQGEAEQASDPNATPKSECPFCVMMRRGGCEAPFQAFMECGERADKAKQEMTECLPLYEALHACMDKNKDVFEALLEEMKAEEAARGGGEGGEGSGSGSRSGGEGGGAVAAAGQQQQLEHGDQVQQQQQQQQQQVQQPQQQEQAVAEAGQRAQQPAG